MLVNNSLNFDGGSKFHSYYGSLAYTLDKNDKKTDLSRYQMNLRQNFIFSPAIKLDIITNIAYEKPKVSCSAIFPAPTAIIYLMQCFQMPRAIHFHKPI